MRKDAIARLDKHSNCEYYVFDNFIKTITVLKKKFYREVFTNCVCFSVYNRCANIDFTGNIFNRNYAATPSMYFSFVQ